MQRDRNVFQIYTGDTKTMNLRFVDRTGNPIDLTNCTELVVILPRADGSFASLSKTGGQVSIPDPKLLGNAAVSISSATSALLNIGQYQDFTATLTIGSDISTVPFLESLSVFEL